MHPCFSVLMLAFLYSSCITSGYYTIWLYLATMAHMTGFEIRPICQAWYLWKLSWSLHLVALRICDHPVSPDHLQGNNSCCMQHKHPVCGLKSLDIKIKTPRAAWTCTAGTVNIWQDQLKHKSTCMGDLLIFSLIFNIAYSICLTTCTLTVHAVDCKF